MDARVVAVVGAVAALIVASSACSSRVPLGGTFEPEEAGPPPAFELEAGAYEPDANTFRPLCKATACPVPYNTCSDDAFRCATNFDIDNANCGACGVVCPNGPPILDTFGAEWFCQSGACKMTCNSDGTTADCNHDPADGCESLVRCDANNCGACGTKCADGTKCIRGNCGCIPGLTACGEGCRAECYDLASDDFNCGACGRECPFQNDPPPPFGMKYGCIESKCGQLKCENGFADCNKVDADGCEITIAEDPKNCGACGKSCAPGQFCENGKCRCAPSETACPGFGTRPECANLDSDPSNCGACGHRCPFVSESGKAVCRLGRCEVECKHGYADCDGRADNGCETHIAADPRNCGACGAQCDLAFGQPCVNGACLLAPCGSGEAK